MTQNAGLQKAIEKAQKLLHKSEMKYRVELAIDGFYIEGFPSRDKKNQPVWTFREIR